MGRKQDTDKLKQLKSKVKAANKESDFRLLKLALVMAVLAFVAAMLNGQLQIW